MKKILFLCTGNYYRSRFAEEYVNHSIQQKIPSLNNWIAISAGLARDITPTRNKGPISPYTLNTLKKLFNIDPSNTPHLNRSPISVEIQDLEKADLIIALNKKEHESMVNIFFPSYKEKIKYLNIPDVDIEYASIAIEQLIIELDNLISNLKSSNI